MGCENSNLNGIELTCFLHNGFHNCAFTIWFQKSLCQRADQPKNHHFGLSKQPFSWLENPIECENLGRTAQRFFQQHNSWDQYAGHIWKRLHNDFRGRRIISKHAKVKSILKNRDCFLHEFPHPDYRSPKSRLMMLSGGEHRERKKLIQEEFTPTRNKALAADWEIVFDRIAANLPENNREIDVIEQLFNPFLSLTIVKMLGLDPEKMSDYLTAAKLIPILIPPEVISFPHDEQMNEYHLQIRKIIGPLDEAKVPPNSLLAKMLRDESEGKINREVTEAMFFDTIGGTVGTLHSFGIKMLIRLSQRPDLWEQLNDDWDFMMNAIDELLRVLAPSKSAVWDRAQNSIAVDGIAIEEGDVVQIGFENANHDPAIFPNPENIDFQRQNAREHMSFGHGAHYCVGADFTKRWNVILLMKMKTLFPVFSPLVARHNENGESKLIVMKA